MTPEDLASSDAPALTEYMTVCSGAGPHADAPEVYTVVSKSGASYRVDIEAGTCDCSDSRYHHAAGGCKHLRRVEFVTGRRPIPKWIGESELDDQLRLDIESETTTPEGPRRTHTAREPPS